jgi:2,3-bisphosphoglycerate-dependent phosphoglycerate mutase
MTDRLLVLARHGQSEGNRRNIFTGWLDLPLTEEGRAEARRAGAKLGALGYQFGRAFASGLSRAAESSAIMLDELGQSATSITASAALNERDYGDLAGLDKDEARERWGAEQVRLWRRSYALAPPGGESLRDTAARVLLYYVRDILPAVLDARGVLVVAHGNSLRALAMALDGLTPAQVEDTELATGQILVYRLAANSSVLSKEAYRV